MELERNRRAEVAVLFVGALLFYVGTAPGRIQETYATENLDAARALLDRGSMRIPQPWSAGRPTYPRHGVGEAILDVPFVLAGRLVGGGEPAAEEWLVSLIPSLFTAILIAVLHRWCGELGARRSRALGVSLTAAFGTILWTYTAIGLEPVLSASVMAAGYSTFAFGRRGGWAWPLAAGAWSGTAVGMKETGALALPALALLFAETWRLRPDRKWWAWLLWGVPIAAGGGLLAATRGEAFVAILGGSLRKTAADGPAQMVFGMWGQLASPNKGLVFYAPVVVLALAAWPALRRREARVARWVLVLALVTVAGVGTLYFWSDETWGPRYDHVLIAPMMLALAVAEAPSKLGRLWWAAWVVAAALGLYVAVIGQLFWYGHLFGVMERAHASELARIQYDPTWNPIEFHSKLLGYRLGVADPAFRPLRRWWFARPVRESIPIVDYARFEPLVLYEGGPPFRGGRVVPGARPLHLLALLLALILGGVVTGSALGAGSRSRAGSAREPPLRPGAAPD